MSRAGDERIVVGIAVIACTVAALAYLSNIPRQHGVGPQPAAAKAQRPASTTTPQPRATAATEPRVVLAITLWPRGPQGARREWSVTCPPMTAACRVALGRTQALTSERTAGCRSSRPRAAEAMVTGYVRGRHMAAWVDQRDGCGQQRWAALRPLLTPPKERAEGQVRTG